MRLITLAITFGVGASLVVAGVAPGGAFVALEHRFAVWFHIVAAFAFAAGARHLVSRHAEVVRERRAGWRYSAATLGAFFATLAAGLFKLGAVSWDAGVFERGTWFRAIADAVYAPAAGAFAAVVAFALASAVLRAARRCSGTARLMLAAAGLFLAADLCRLAALSPASFTALGHSWVLSASGLARAIETLGVVPADAGVRALTIDIAVGVIASGTRILAGADRVA